jgi:hypothetical protein
MTSGRSLKSKKLWGLSEEGRPKADKRGGPPINYHFNELSTPGDKLVRGYISRRLALFLLTTLNPSERSLIQHSPPSLQLSLSAPLIINFIPLTPSNWNYLTALSILCSRYLKQSDPYQLPNCFHYVSRHRYCGRGISRLLRKSSSLH